MKEAELRQLERIAIESGDPEDQKRFERELKRSGRLRPLTLQLSASKLETAFGERTGCRRKWWLKHVRRLPVAKTASQAFGTVTHSVCERWLKADRRGIDPETGEPVELYPEGWETDIDRKGEKTTVTPREAKLIRVLVEKAIEEGILEREAGRVIEHEFKYHLLTVESRTGEKTRVNIKGFIDVLLPYGITDHKTTKNLRWAKSANKLRTNIQMLVYAMVLVLLYRERGETVPEQIQLAHNYFEKDFDNPRLRKVVTMVPTTEVEDHWDQVKEWAKELVFLTEAKTWEQVPGPKSTASACNAFGGCEFRGICSKRETTDRYTRRINRQLAQAGLNTTRKPEEVKPVKVKSFEERLKEKEAKKKKLNAQKKKRKTGAAPEQGVNPPKPKTMQTREREEPAKFTGTPAPWAQADCVACGGSGMASNGNPCRICVGEAPGKLHPSNYDKAVDGDGNIQWVHKESGDGFTSKPEVGKATAKKIERESEAPKKATKKKKKKKKAAAKKKKKATKKPEPEAKTVTEEDTPQQVPAMGFVLCYGCRPTKGAGMGVRTLEDLLAEYGAALAKKNKVDSFWKLDAFARRDRLREVAPKIAKRLGGLYIVVPRHAGPDLSALASALRPLAVGEFVAE